MFQESALRNSVAKQTSGGTVPYWQSTGLAPLVGTAGDAGISPSAGNHEQLIGFPPFTDGHVSPSHQRPSTHYNVPHGYRPLSYDQGNDFANFSHVLSQSFDDARPASPAPPRARVPLTVRTPTGLRSMRRPGLAGASALINGQYCCQWAVHGAGCGLKFNDAKQLNDHIKLHHVRGAGDFECQWHGCDKGSFPTANKLVRHVHSHTGYKPFPCLECSQAFVTKDQLDKHLTTHTGAKDFTCAWPGCGRSFAVKHALEGHVNSVHLKAKKHTCPHCFQAFDDSSNLSKHKKQVHNKDTAIKCPARRTHGCTYVDSRKDKMKEHCEREGHGLETVDDPHAWNMWVQQFKTGSKKADHRRQSRDVLSCTPMSRTSSISTSPLTATPHTSTSLECTRQGCNMPVCLPCNMLCNDLHSASLSAPCDNVDCDPCDLDPGCNGTDCDPSTRQPCNIPPCNLPHCQSVCSSPTQPSTPLGMHGDPYFQMHHMYGENDLFHNSDYPF